MAQAGHVDGLLVFSGDRKIITRRSNVSEERPKFLTGKPRMPLVLLAQGLVFSWRLFLSHKFHCTIFHLWVYLTSPRMTFVVLHTDITETWKE